MCEPNVLEILNGAGVAAADTAANAARLADRMSN